MRMLIDGILFDTERAEIIAEASSDAHPQSAEYWQEFLFKNKHGYFLKRTAGSFAPPPTFDQLEAQGESMMVLTEEQVKEWFRAHPEAVRDVIDEGTLSLLEED